MQMFLRLRFMKINLYSNFSVHLNKHEKEQTFTKKIMDNVSYAYGFQNLKYISKQKKLYNRVRCILGMDG